MLRAAGELQACRKPYLERNVPLYPAAAQHAVCREAVGHRRGGGRASLDKRQLSAGAGGRACRACARTRRYYVLGVLFLSLCVHKG